MNEDQYTLIGWTVWIIVGCLIGFLCGKAEDENATARYSVAFLAHWVG